MYAKKVHYVAMKRGQSGYLCGIYGDYLRTDEKDKVTCNTCRIFLNMPKVPIYEELKMNNPVNFDNKLFLSVRSANVLRNNNITTVAELEKLTFRELLKMKNLGRISYVDIVEEMKRHGLYLFGEKPESPEFLETSAEVGAYVAVRESASLESLFKSLEVTISVIKTRLKNINMTIQNSQEIIRINQENREKARKYDEIMDTINKK